MRIANRRDLFPTHVRASARASVALALALSACAKAPGPAPATPAAALAPLPRSSIAAVVLHRGELGLTDDQVRQLELIDQRREAEDAAIRDELAKHHAQKAAGQAPASGGGASSASGSPAGGGNGGGMRGGGMGMGRGGGMRGRMPRASGTDATKGANAEATAQDRMDDDDTKAYLEGEDILEARHSGRAGATSPGSMREQLYDRRARVQETTSK